VHETGWGEFEIAIKLYYVSESAEKPQTLYHHLRLHPYGNSEEEKEVMRASGEIPSWAYDEQLFNEPYEPFYETLTSGALPPPPGAPKSASGKGGKSKEKAPPQPSTTPGGVLERSAMIPDKTRPGQPFSKETEALEIKKLREAQVKVADMAKKLAEELKEKEEKLRALKVSAAN
jgi:YEATS domain-containing protein 4